MKKGDIVYANNHKVQIVEVDGNGGGIVQEIHVDDEGNEFPAGPTRFEKKLVCELEGALTWYGRQTKLEEERHNTLKAKLEGLRRDINIQIEANTEHLRNLRQVAGLEDLSVLDRVLDFLAGDIRWIVELDYDYKITKFMDAITNTDSWSFRRYDGLKLMTLVGGRANGKKTLNWNLNLYYDGSGCNTTVIPCKTKKEALATVQSYINNLLAEGKDIKLESALALGCKVPTEYIQKRIKKAQDDHAKILADRKKAADKSAKDLETKIANLTAFLPKAHGEGE